MRVRRCCVANCGCRRLRGDFGKDLYNFPKWLRDAYAVETGQGGGKLSFDLPSKPDWRYVCLCAPSYAKVLHKLYGDGLNNNAQHSIGDIFVDVCRELDKCGYRDGDADGAVALDEADDAAVAPPETGPRLRKRPRLEDKQDPEPAPTPSTPGDGPPTEGPWTDDTVREHPLVALLLRVLRSGSPEGVYTGAWLRSDTLTFAQMHTAYREILIGHGAGVGLGKLWMDAYADKMLRWAMSYENRFTRSVVDAWYGVGESGLGRGRGGAHQYDVAERRAICGLPPYSAIQIRRPPQSHAGLLVKVTKESCDKFADLVLADSRRRGERKRRHLVGVTMDFTASGRTRAEAVRSFLVQGVARNVVLGPATNADGSGGCLTEEDIKKLFEKFTDVQLAKGITTVLLHDARGLIPGGFLLALVPVGDEHQDLVKHIYTEARRFLFDRGVWVTLLGTDYGSVNVAAFTELEAASTFKELPADLRKIKKPGDLPLVFVPDLREHAPRGVRRRDAITNRRAGHKASRPSFL